MEDYLKIARKAAEEAGIILKKKIKEVKILQKKDQAVDLLTSADLAAQELIVGIIKDNFPYHSILSEEMEEGLSMGSKEYLWAIDPIDGTSAYSLGLPTFSSSIALLHNRQPIVGAIYVAIFNEVIYGAKGYGVFRGKRNKKLKIKNTTKLIDSAVGFDPGYHERERYFKAIAKLTDKVRIMPIIWSQATSLALVALGVLDGYIQYSNPKIWDVAAGKLLVEETGGVMTDFYGKPVDLFAINGYIAGTKSIHQQLLSYSFFNKKRGV